MPDEREGLDPDLTNALRSAIMSKEEQEILAALPVDQVKAERWQPIETAPKDGSRLLVTRAPFTGKAPYKIVWWSSSTPKGWRWRLSKLVRFNPTHWMPLPEPPAIRNLEQSDEA